MRPSHDLSGLNRTRKAVAAMVAKTETLAATLDMMRPDYRMMSSDAVVALTQAVCELECTRSCLLRTDAVLAEAENRIAALAEAQEVARG